MATPVGTQVEGRSTGSTESRRRSSRHEDLETALAVGERLLCRLRVIDFTSYEPLSAVAAVSFMVSGAALQADQSAAEAIALIRRLPGLVFGDACDDVDDVGDALEIDEVFDAVDGTPDHPGDRLNEEIDAALLPLTAPHSWARAGEIEMLRPMAPMLARELQNARSRLERAIQERSKWGIITEGDETRRKSIKSLQLVIVLAGCALPDRGFPDSLIGPTELEMALRVRRTLLALRDSIRRCVTTQVEVTRPEAVRGMQALHDILRELCGSTDYRELRSADRYAIQGLRKRVDAWLGTDHRAAHEARDVLRDAAAFAELLGDVNKREILVQHDRCVRDNVLTDLTGLRDTLCISASGAVDRFRAALNDARDLVDRDLELAAWLDRRQASVGQAISLAEALDDAIARLEALRI